MRTNNKKSIENKIVNINENDERVGNNQNYYFEENYLNINKKKELK